MYRFRKQPQDSPTAIRQLWAETDELNKQVEALWRAIKELIEQMNNLLRKLFGNERNKNDGETNIIDGSGIDGSGTANQLPLWVDSDTLGDSIAAQTGTTNINVVATDAASTSVTYALTITHRIS